MSRKSTLSPRYAWLLLGVFAGLLVLASLPARAGDERGRCYSAEVSDPIVLPDQSVHPPGRLKICFTIEHSPVAALHETYVDGRPIGLYTSRRESTEAGAEQRPFFLFLRDKENSLRLVGYAAPSGKILRKYDLIGKGRVTTHWRVEKDTDQDNRVLVAAMERDSHPLPRK